MTDSMVTKSGGITHFLLSHFLSLSRSFPSLFIRSFLTPPALPSTLFSVASISSQMRHQTQAGRHQKFSDSHRVVFHSKRAVLNNDFRKWLLKQECHWCTAVLPPAWHGWHPIVKSRKQLLGSLHTGFYDCKIFLTIESGDASDLWSNVTNKLSQILLNPSWQRRLRHKLYVSSTSLQPVPRSSMRVLSKTFMASVAVNRLEFNCFPGNAVKIIFWEKKLLSMWLWSYDLCDATYMMLKNTSQFTVPYWR